MSISPGMTVADIGAGTGYFTEHLSAAVGPEGTVLALDIEPNLVEFIQQRAEQEGWGNVRAQVVAPDDPGLDAASVDRVLIVNTWHHIGERPAYVARLQEALRPGGAVFVVDYTRESEHGPPVQHRLLPEEVAAELEAGGLTPEILDETLPEQYVVAGRKE
jgi:ubiquinone/menaquinone biosynthesis C-methylase UbiE